MRANHASCRIKVATALRTGCLKRKPCERCGRSALAHHEDYRRPLAITWLCAIHHAMRHSDRAVLGLEPWKHPYSRKGGKSNMRTVSVPVTERELQRFMRAARKLDVTLYQLARERLLMGRG